MPSERRPRFLLLLWTLFLLAPIAWSLTLSVNFALVHVACERGTRTPLFVLTAVCLLAALAAAVVARRKLAQTPQVGDAAQRSRFMLGLSVGMGALFALVIVLSAVPIFLLSACPT
jgi:hypothetical protein